ncbi:hypothetical protein KUCAC02_004438, partial [Chaenocephalus aceratus]
GKWETRAWRMETIEVVWTMWESHYCPPALLYLSRKHFEDSTSPAVLSCLGASAAFGLTSGLPAPVLHNSDRHTHKHTTPHHPGWMRDSRPCRQGTASDQWRGSLGAARSQISGRRHYNSFHLSSSKWKAGMPSAVARAESSLAECMSTLYPEGPPEWL